MAYQTVKDFPQLPRSQSLMSDREIAACAYQAGFRGSAEVTAVAVALAESGGIEDAVGDVTIQTNTYGPSTGLWQIRSLKSQYGTNKQRDGLVNQNGVSCARHAYQISNGGGNWRPWSTYTNGRYRQFLSRASAAVTGTGDGWITNGPGSANAGPDNPTPWTPGVATGSGGPSGLPASSGPTLNTSATGPIFDPDLPNDAGIPLRISGSRLSGELGTLFTGGSMEFSAEESSILTVSFVDERYGLANKYWLEEGAVIDFTGVRWLISQVNVGDQDGVPITTYQALPSGVKAMKEQTTGSRASIDPTTFMASVAKGAGLAFFGEPTGTKQVVTPDTVERPDQNKTDPLKVLVPSLPQKVLPPTETAWELGTRLAGLAGYVMFEAAGTLVFASQDYIAERAASLVVASSDDRPSNLVKGRSVWVRPMTRPQVQVMATDWTTNHKTGRRTPHAHDLSYRVDLPREYASQLTIGMPVKYTGIGPYGYDGTINSAAATYVSRITTDLSKPYSPVTIESKRNYAPIRPRTTASPVTRDRDGNTKLPATSSTGRRAVDMVTVALSQDGDRYVWGAEASKKDPNPDAFDCSELVEWACGRVGAYMPDGSANQRAYCVRHGTSISVAKAIRTRGALMFMGSPVHHVAISLGNGKTIEARGRAYGVGSFSATRGFTSAGLVPSLRY